MADQPARGTRDDKLQKAPLKTKVVRSQKISNLTSPIDRTATPDVSASNSKKPTSISIQDKQNSQQNNDESDARDRAPSIPRSHTPGHLASKSQDRKRKPSELSIRQRSQSSSAATPPSQTPTGPPTSKTPGPPATNKTSLPPPTSKTPGPYLSPGRRRENSEGVAGTSQHERSRSKTINEDGNASGSGSGSSAGSSGHHRPTALRSTSAIASKAGAREGGASAGGAAAGASSGATAGSTAPTGGAGGGERAASSGGGNSSRQASATHHGRNHAAGRGGTYNAFPPLADPRTAPDVPPAPASGMYWSRAPVSGHPHTALRAHTTTLVGSNVYVFGGCDSRACFNELYVLDADAFYWSAPFVSGEIPVPLRAMTCTAVGKKLVIFGGGDGPAYYNDVYVLDTVNFRWSRPRIMGDRAPSKRRAHTACLYKNGIYVFGGGDGVRALNDIWRLDVSDTAKMSWKLISSPTSEKSPSSTKDGSRPKARGYHTANMVGSKLIIFGGSDGGECFNDVWVYDVETHVWKAVSIPVTFRRLSHTATIVGSYLFVIGGHDGNEYSNDVLLLNLVTMTWDKRKVYGLPPSGRGYHGTVLYDSRLMMIGGFDGSEVFGDVWILELAVHAYYSQISHFSIEV